VKTSSLLAELVEVPVHVSSGRPKEILTLLETVQLFQHDQRKNYIVSWKRVNALHVMKENRRINYKNFSGTQHVIPANIVTKAELLESFAQVYNREDIKINPIVSKLRIDRTLTTQDMSLSNNLWKIAGYDKPPTIQEMIEQQNNFMILHK
jgi:hypothetical protein